VIFSPDRSGNPFLRFLPKKRLQRIAGLAPKKLFHYNSKDYGIKQFINVPESFLIYKLLRKFAEIL